MLKSLFLALFLHLLLAAGPAGAATIPASPQASFQSESGSASTIPPFSSVALVRSVSATQAMPHQQPQIGHNYALDPFGFLGSSENHENNDADTRQTKQSSASRAMETNSGAATSKTAPSSTVSAKSGGTTKTESLSTASPATATATASASSTWQSFGFLSATSSMTGTSLEVTPSQVYEGTDAAASSGTGMNAWKVLGIGILAFVGIVLLVFCTAFQDAILRVLCQPFQRRKDGEEVLVPDWHRGSWRFGEDGVSIEKAHCTIEDEEGPRIGENGKGSLAVPLPPISPFPLRRTPSTTSSASAGSRIQAEPGLANVAPGNVASSKIRSNDYSTLSSPLPAHTLEPSKRRSMRDPFASPRESLLDAYGGME